MGIINTKINNQREVNPANNTNNGNRVDTYDDAKDMPIAGHHGDTFDDAKDMPSVVVTDPSLSEGRVVGSVQFPTSSSLSERRFSSGSPTGLSIISSKTFSGDSSEKEGRVVGNIRFSIDKNDIIMSDDEDHFINAYMNGIVFPNYAFQMYKIIKPIIAVFIEGRDEFRAIVDPNSFDFTEGAYDPGNIKIALDYKNYWFSPKITIINLQYIDIENLGEQFNSFPNLKVLYLTGCNIKTITKSFTPAKLEILIINYERNEPKILADLSKIKHVKIVEMVDHLYTTMTNTPIDS